MQLEKVNPVEEKEVGMASNRLQKAIVVNADLVNELEAYLSDVLSGLPKQESETQEDCNCCALATVIHYACNHIDQTNRSLQQIINRLQL